MWCKSFNDDNVEIIDKIKSFGQLVQIDRNVINELIDFIKIYDNESIEVKFKYKNLYEYALRYLDN